ncbi:MAG: Holliday junction branch migration protein RuvA [Saprospiraceae bacterium]|jgi:Holliday junction DNA helicase RuvA|nr:Holliday junction branch migration protein RuvA [Saprospiraceae bacterium]MCA0334276.1 Holliday junction branch migration protein RuvA [Bacteroidota bacterium]MCB0604666.1 Holliday junction branch migration protein RuvA [Saprospiraceae bacterium]MCO5278850.1 Holliday junction branch migration protein RuvA [Saprospiraceae bacterium]HMT77018.1 Holliday junction branch migration protein RuvA [Saprospiraceae bacterium]
MIAYIDGKITALTPTYVLIETAGIGYHVNISLNTYAALDGKDRVKLLTTLLIKEDAHTLYGFATEEERSLFQLLITVNGVGAGTARLVLSSMPARDISQAISQENERLFVLMKGIGPKTAKRIIIDLKDKVTKMGDIPTSSFPSISNHSVRDEAGSALLALGFQKNAVDKVLNSLSRDSQEYTLEQMVKAALKQLSGG